MLELRSPLGKARPNQICEFGIPVPNGGVTGIFSEDFRKMNARPQVREAIIARKLQRWSMISRYRFIEAGYSRARARKNFWRLLARYPEIGARLGLSETSVY